MLNGTKASGVRDMLLLLLLINELVDAKINKMLQFFSRVFGLKCYVHGNI